jgi:hypothetical protein
LGLKEEILGWDVENWGSLLDFALGESNFEHSTVLELGCGCDNGGLSLWAAKLGAKNIVCSDYHFPRETTLKIHKVYGLDDLIKYQSIDALDIPYSNFFDIVCFKSMLGGIVREKSVSLCKQVFFQIAKALKKGGMLIFAENLESSYLHSLLRKKFGAGRNKWHYFHKDELPTLLKSMSEYELISHETAGISGCFGRTEAQRILLGKLDRLFLERILPEKFRYIQFIIAKKIV